MTTTLKYKCPKCKNIGTVNEIDPDHFECLKCKNIMSEEELEPGNRIMSVEEVKSSGRTQASLNRMKKMASLQEDVAQAKQALIDALSKGMHFRDAEKFLKNKRYDDRVIGFTIGQVAAERAEDAIGDTGGSYEVEGEAETPNSSGKPQPSGPVIASLNRQNKIAAFVEDVPLNPSHRNPRMVPVGLEAAENYAKWLLQGTMSLKNSIKGKDIYNLPADKIDQLRDMADKVVHYAEFLKNALNGLGISGEPEEMEADERQRTDVGIVDNYRKENNL
jgi:hypothetical protein